MSCLKAAVLAALSALCFSVSSVFITFNITAVLTTCVSV